MKYLLIVFFIVCAQYMKNRLIAGTMSFFLKSSSVLADIIDNAKLLMMCMHGLGFKQYKNIQCNTDHIVYNMVKIYLNGTLFC